MDYFETRDNIFDSDNTFSSSVVRTQVNRNTPMYQFFKGLNVFLTGASGFMGKVFIEKLLRCYPEVGGIYILLRSKKNKTVQERLAEQFKDELFDRLKNEQADILQRKVHIISGDISQPSLGISSHDQQFIQHQIHVIIHAAASLRFDELIQDAFTLNIQATRELMDLATRCSQLKVILHVSTLYTHSYREDIQEEFYPPLFSYEDLAHVMQTTNQEELEILSSMLFGGIYNNSYSFTKAIGESVVEKYLHKLPLAMVRPSIVVSTWKEPIVGWSNNLYGPGGAAAGAALGLIHTFYAKHDKKCDLIPVDVATNMILGVVWKTALDHGHVAPPASLVVPIPRTDPPVYNLSISSSYPITWLEYMNSVQAAGKCDEQYIASVLAIWTYTFSMEQNQLMYLLRVWFLHMIPGMIMDTVLRCLNKPPRLMKIYAKIMKFSKYFKPYVERDWVFGTHHVANLLRQIPPEDQTNVDFSMEGFTWPDYMIFYFRGGKLYVLKDPYSRMEKGRIHFRRLKAMHFLFLSLVYSLLAWVLYKVFFPYVSAYLPKIS
ncbi:hypothetical protein M8J76_000504 [Diaphorina citri]|nr:hypothetical protein M8J76_000504 [Diaphorina citri]